MSCRVNPHWKAAPCRRLLGAFFISPILVLGCATMPSRPVAEQAAEMERARCGPDVDEAALAPIFAGGSLESARPLYAAASPGGNAAGGNYSRLIGASIKLFAGKGFTAEWLDRALECHSARRVLGRIPATAIPDDPFWLPGRMVDIEVAATRDGFQVYIRGQNVKDAEEILARVNAFVAARVGR